MTKLGALFAAGAILAAAPSVAQTVGTCSRSGGSANEAEVAKVLTEAGLDARKVGNRIQEQDVKDRLKATTDEAVARGVFGAPTSFVGDMMFFGNDRLPFVEMALKGNLK